MSSAPPSTSPTTAVVVAGEEETRVLLRGLLRLHRFRVLGEASGVTPGLQILDTQAPTVLVVDSELAEGTAVDLVVEGKRRHPRTRVVLVAHGSRPMLPPDAPAPDVVLQRPFRIREFAEAITVPPEETPP